MRTRNQGFLRFPDDDPLAASVWSEQSLRNEVIVPSFFPDQIFQLSGGGPNPSCANVLDILPCDASNPQFDMYDRNIPPFHMKHMSWYPADHIQDLNILDILPCDDTNRPFDNYGCNSSPWCRNHRNRYQVDCILDLSKV